MEISYRKRIKAEKKHPVKHVRRHKHVALQSSGHLNPIRFRAAGACVLDYSVCEAGVRDGGEGGEREKE